MCNAHSSFCPFSQHKTLHRTWPIFPPLSAQKAVSPTVQFLPSLSTNNCIINRSVPPLSQHRKLYRQALMYPLYRSPLASPPFQNKSYKLSPHIFSLLSVYINVIATAKLPLSQHTTQFLLPHILSSLSAHKSVSPTRQFPHSYHKNYYRPPLRFSPFSTNNTV